MSKNASGEKKDSIRSLRSSSESDLSEDEEEFLRPNPSLGAGQTKVAMAETFATTTTTTTTPAPARRFCDNGPVADRAVSSRWGGKSFKVLSVDIGVRNLVLAFLDFERPPAPSLAPKSRKRKNKPLTEETATSGDERLARCPWGDFVVRSVEVLDVVTEKLESDERSSDESGVRAKKAGKKKPDVVSTEEACRCVYAALESRRARFSEEIDRAVIELQPTGESQGVRNPSVAHFVLAYFFDLFGADKVEFQSATRKLCVFFDPTFDSNRLFEYLAERRRRGLKTSKKKNCAFLSRVAQGLVPWDSSAEEFPVDEGTPAATTTPASKSLRETFLGLPPLPAVKPAKSKGRVKKTAAEKPRKELTDSQVKEIVYSCNKFFSVHQVKCILRAFSQDHSIVSRFVESLEKSDDACDAVLQALFYVAELRRCNRTLPPGCESDVVRPYRAASHGSSAHANSSSSSSASSEDPKPKRRAYAAMRSYRR